MTTIRRTVYKSIPAPIRRGIKKFLKRPVYRSQFNNVFHCTTHKAASQWIRIVLSDASVFKYSGLRPYSYDNTLPGKSDTRSLTHKVITHRFPKNTIATPLYIDFSCYKRIPKSGDSRAVFILRDPRDVLVSFYFSALKTHALKGKFPRIRQALRVLDQEQGLLYALHYLHQNGTFEAQRSWMTEGIEDPDVLVLRFEDMISENDFNIWKDLFDHFDIALPDDILDMLLDKYSFSALSDGRPPGVENINSHYRKGTQGDWKNYFTRVVVDQFKLIADDLLTILGYQE